MGMTRNTQYGFVAIIKSEIYEETSSDLGNGKILGPGFTLVYSGDALSGYKTKKLLAWQPSVKELDAGEFISFDSRNSSDINRSLEENIKNEAARLELEIDTIGWAAWVWIG